MSRVHDALRRAEQNGHFDPKGMPGDEPPAEPAQPPARVFRKTRPEDASSAPVAVAEEAAIVPASGLLTPDMLADVQEVPYNPASEAHLISLNSTHETPAEEFRTLRTRLNHLQTLQPLHNVIITSPSPAEGKTFTAVNLALAQSQLTEHTVFLADLDLRRPTVHHLLQIERAPGISDYLLGRVPLSQAIRKIAGTNLYFMPAGSPVKNPLELLNLRQAKALFEELPRVFNWAIFDTPPLLFSADANLLATMADGTILVVRIGATTYDSVIRAMQSLCENNVLGIVANGAQASELYSKYTYYYSKTE